MKAGREMSEGEGRREDIAIDAAGLLFESRIALAAVHHGVQMLARRSTAPSVTAELQTLAELTDQACDALEALQKVVLKHLTH